MVLFPFQDWHQQLAADAVSGSGSGSGSLLVPMDHRTHSLRASLHSESWPVQSQYEMPIESNLIVRKEKKSWWMRRFFKRHQEIEESKSENENENGLGLGLNLNLDANISPLRPSNAFQSDPDPDLDSELEPTTCLTLLSNAPLLIRKYEG